MLRAGDMHWVAVALEELWAERPEPRTAAEVALKLCWWDGPRFGPFDDFPATPDEARAETAIFAAIEHRLILPAAVCA